MDPLTFAADIGTAFVLGLVIGIERELRHHEAGLRTNALVALGAALFVSLARMVDHEGSPTRVAGQVVSGIGFLAGGVIIRDGFSVRGLTTAATLWCTAAIGTLAGSGFLIAASIGTATVVILHLTLRPMSAWLNSQAKLYTHAEAGYQLRVVCGAGMEPSIREKILEAIHGRSGMTLLGLHGQPGPQAGERVVVAEVHAPAPDDPFIERIASSLLIAAGVSSAGWDRLTGRPVN